MEEGETEERSVRSFPKAYGRQPGGRERADAVKTNVESGVRTNPAVLAEQRDHRYRCDDEHVFHRDGFCITSPTTDLRRVYTPRGHEIAGATYIGRFDMGHPNAPKYLSSCTVVQ